MEFLTPVPPLHRMERGQGERLSLLGAAKTFAELKGF
jgi:hypothetical protein